MDIVGLEENSCYEKVKKENTELRKMVVELRREIQEKNKNILELEKDSEKNQRKKSTRLSQKDKDQGSADLRLEVMS